MDHATESENQDGGDGVYCKNCGSAEIDGSGKCAACGHAQTGSVTEAEAAGESLELAGAFEIESSVSDPANQAEMPGWRLELSRRLQELKQKRGGPGQPETEPVSPSPAPAAEPAAPPNPPPVPPETSVPDMSHPSHAPAPAAVATASRLGQTRAALPGDVGSRRLELPPPRKAPQDELERKHEDVRSLIDRVTAREAADEPPSAPGRTPDVPSLPLGEPEVDKLILLTRTFSGLIDLVLVVMFASALIFAVDIIEGIEVFDAVSLLHSLMLFAATFLVYSVFFLATANQTIGMMITDLRVTGEGHARPNLRQVFIRSALYLLALGLAGAGLAAGFLDPQARCLHDRLSGTTVTRLSEA